MECFVFFFTFLFLSFSFLCLCVLMGVFVLSCWLCSVVCISVSVWVALFRLDLRIGLFKRNHNKTRSIYIASGAVASISFAVSSFLRSFIFCTLLVHFFLLISIPSVWFSYFLNSSCVKWDSSLYGKTLFSFFFYASYIKRCCSYGYFFHAQISYNRKSTKTLHRTFSFRFDHCYWNQFALIRRAVGSTYVCFVF